LDLRGNFGGNMWPMLLSIEPLIGNGTFGYFIDANENSEAWKIIEGKAYIEDQFVMETKILSKQDLSNQFLAVLTDHQTASSGEAVAVAFKVERKFKIIWTINFWCFNRMCFTRIIRWFNNKSG
jgi:carboxyl-terminal processing protease